MKMYYKYYTYCRQDIRLKKLLFWIVACFMITLHLLEVLPFMSVATRWHTVKDFILASLYEYFYIPIFLILLAPFHLKTMIGYYLEDFVTASNSLRIKFALFLS